MQWTPRLRAIVLGGAGLLVLVVLRSVANEQPAQASAYERRRFEAWTPDLGPSNPARDLAGLELERIRDEDVPAHVKAKYAPIEAKMAAQAKDMADGLQFAPAHFEGRHGLVRVTNGHSDIDFYGFDYDAFLYDARGALIERVAGSFSAKEASARIEGGGTTELRVGPFAREPPANARIEIVVNRVSAGRPDGPLLMSPLPAPAASGVAP